MNSILAKMVCDNQRDWDVRLPFVMAAYRTIRHEATGYSPNFLVLNREARALPDIVFGHPDEKNEQSYDSFVEKVRQRFVEAFATVRHGLQQSAEHNKRYYDIGLKTKQFAVGK